jgi:hypothetical protein
MFLGAVHFAGHLAAKATTPSTAAEKQLEVLMREVQVTALGASRSVEEMTDGFSIAFALCTFLIGVLAMLVGKHGSQSLVMATRVLCAAMLGILTGVGMRSWVPPTVMLTGLAALCFLISLAVARLEPTALPPAASE